MSLDDPRNDPRSDPRAELPAPIAQLVDRLRTTYRGRVAPGTVDDVVRSCYAPLADAKISSFVPNLVEHTSRERLRALVATVGQPV